MRVPLEWLKEFAEIRVKPEKLSFALTMSGLEVEAIERVGSETIFEIGVTPNRADCLSMIGVAREVSAVSGGRFKPPKSMPPRGAGMISNSARIQVKARALCPRYCARAVEGVKIGPSPAWMIRRLASCGIRSINNVVDSTNYVMLETGQPLHAFDLRFIRGKRVEVRTAGEKKPFAMLDGVERTLEPDDLVICDAEGPVALAGVMGGQNSEVRESTTSILLESAFFEPRGVRRTSRRLGLSSESSRRFERGVDPSATLQALHRLTEIIIQTAGGTPSSDWADIYPKKIAPRRISVGEEETNRALGTKLKAAEMARILGRLGFAAKTSGRGKLAVSVPTFRFDIERPIDLVEEIARVYGYGQIPETMPLVRVAPLSRPRFYREAELVRDALADSGLSEALLYGFTSEASLEPFGEIGEQPVKIANPLSSEQGVMCTTLLPGLLDAMKLNSNRQRMSSRLFALQRVFFRPMRIGPSEEPRHVAGLILGPRFPGAWERSAEKVDFYDAKGVVEALLGVLKLDSQAIYQRGDAYRFLHPGAFAYVIVGGKRVGFVGQLHPDVAARWDQREKVFAFELDFEALAEIAAAQAARFAELSRFPFVERDLALVVEDRIPAVEVERTIQECGEELVGGVRIFDVYRGDGLPAGHKSLGVTLTFASSERTLTDREVEEAQGKIVGALKNRLGAQLRT